MNFTRCVTVTDEQSRQDMIQTEIENHAWTDELEAEQYMRFGGWPDDVQVEKIAFDESDDEIIATVDIAFAESVPSSCKDYNHDYKCFAQFNVIIDRAYGEYEIDNLDFEHDTEGGAEDEEDGFDFEPDTALRDYE